jgi:hypothetical protein
MFFFISQISINVGYAQGLPTPIRYYPLNGENNTNEIINGKNGVAHGNITLVADRFGDPTGAFDLSQNCYIETPSFFEGIDISKGRYSITCWIYIRNSGALPSDESIFFAASGSVITRKQLFGLGLAAHSSTATGGIQITRYIPGSNGNVSENKEFSYWLWSPMTSQYCGDGKWVFVAISLTKQSTRVYMRTDNKDAVWATNYFPSQDLSMATFWGIGGFESSTTNRKSIDCIDDFKVYADSIDINQFNQLYQNETRPFQPTLQAGKLYRIRNVRSHLYLCYSPNGDCCQYDANTAYGRDVWMLENRPQAGNGWKILSYAPLNSEGETLDLYRGSTEDNAGVGLWGEHGGMNQNWDISLFDGFYEIRSQSSGYPIAVKDGGTAVGDQVVQCTVGCLPGSNYWVFEEVTLPKFPIQSLSYVLHPVSLPNYFADHYDNGNICFITQVIKEKYQFIEENDRYKHFTVLCSGSEYPRYTLNCFDGLDRHYVGKWPNHKQPNALFKIIPRKFGDYNIYGYGNDIIYAQSTGSWFYEYITKWGRLADVSKTHLVWSIYAPNSPFTQNPNIEDYKITNVANGKVLDAYDYQPASVVGLWDWRNGTNQIWHVSSITDDFSVTLSDQRSNYVLDVFGNSTADNAPIIVYPAKPQTLPNSNELDSAAFNQRWFVQSSGKDNNGNDMYHIINRKSGKCLALNNNYVLYPYGQQLVQVSIDNPNYAKTWYFDPISSSSYYRASNVVNQDLTSMNTKKEIEGIFDVRPNPVEESINVYLSSDIVGTVIFSISDYNGRVVFKDTKVVKAGELEVEILVPNLQKGIYVLTVSNSNGTKLKSKRIIVK